MPQCDGATVYIYTFRIQMEITIAGDHLCRKSFVQFDEIDIFKTEPLSLQQGADCGHWTNPHDLRRNAGDLIVNNASLRFSPELLQRFFAHHHHSRGAVGYS